MRYNGAKLLLAWLGVLVCAFHASAYLPNFEYVIKPVTRDRSQIWWRGNKGVVTNKGYSTKDEVAEVIIDGETYETDEVYQKGGPIRYYYEVVMPRIMGEPLFAEMSEQTHHWMARNLPTNSSNIKIKKATTRAQELITVEKMRKVDLLMEYRDEIGKVYNEYVRYGVDVHNLEGVCKEYRKLLNDRYWRNLQKSTSSYNGVSQNWLTQSVMSADRRKESLRNFRWGEHIAGFLEFGCGLDVAIAKAYEPLIDVRIAEYRKYKESIGTGGKLDADAEKKIAAAVREAKRANRKAQEADNRAVQAIQEAEEAKRRAGDLNLDPSNKEDRWLIRQMHR